MTDRTDAPRGMRAAALVIASVSALSGLLWVATAGMPALASSPKVPFLVMALAFAVSESLVLHLQFRREHHTIVLSETTLIVALLVLAPHQVVLARVLGAFIPTLRRVRGNPVKLAFNVALLVLEPLLASIVIHALGTSDVLSLRTWAVAIIAAVAAVAAGYVATSAVIAAVSGSSPLVVLRRTGPPGLVITLGNSALGLLALACLATQPLGIAIIVALAFLGWWTLKALDRQRRRADSLEVLHGVTRRFADAEDVESLVEALLAEVRTAAGSDAGIVVLADRDVAHVLDGGSGAIRQVPLHALALDAGPWRDVPELGVVRVSGSIAGVTVREGFAARLVGDGGEIGLVVAANGTSRLLGITEAQEKAFGTTVSSAAVALQRCSLLTRLRHQALHDPVTGLPNRTALYEEVERRLAGGREVAVLLVDLDRFKDVNDALGHASGDELLQVLAHRLSDPATVGGAFVARLGGDDLAMVIDDADDWFDVAERVRAIVERPLPLSGITLHVTASVGVAIAPDDGCTAESLIQHADVAVDLARSTPVGIARYDADKDPSSLARLAMLGDLRDAIDRGDLDVVFQPQAELVTGDVVAVEALVRWHHPVHGQVPPDVFVPLAEHAGLIRPLTRHVLRSALMARQHWAADGIELRVSVNLSVRDLLDTSLPGEVIAELVATRTPPSALVLEITETSVMVDTVRTRAVLERLHELGVGLAVDDFGTGYSSLAYLKVLPVDEVKIDRAFVAEVATDPSDAAIVRSVIELGRHLGLRVVAEGVEDDAAWHTLRGLGCDVAQGYLLCRPMSARDVSVWLDRRLGHAPLASAHGRPAGADRGALGASGGAVA